MNHNLTHLLFILDRSGSMQSMADAAIDGFNSFLREHLAAPGDARLTLVLFDDQYEIACDAVPLPEVLPLTPQSYTPRGTTALLDATARAIDELGARFAATPEPDRPATVITAILTDGLENSSRHFTWPDVSRRIITQTQDYNWQFLFLGANQDAIATAARIGINAENAATFRADHIGIDATMAGIAAKSKSIRKHRAGHRLNELETTYLHKNMEHIVREEDQKRRGDS